MKASTNNIIVNYCQIANMEHIVYAMCLRNWQPGKFGYTSTKCEYSVAQQCCLIARQHERFSSVISFETIILSLVKILLYGQGMCKGTKTSCTLSWYTVLKPSHHIWQCKDFLDFAFWSFIDALFYRHASLHQWP